MMQGDFEEPGTLASRKVRAKARIKTIREPLELEQVIAIAARDIRYEDRMFRSRGAPRNVT